MSFNISGVKIGPGARINGGVVPRGTLANPGLNAVDIYNSGQTSSGWYYVKTSAMTSSKLVYCNMIDEGGGWMLITYNPNQLSSNGMFYPNTWGVNGQGTLDKFSVNVMDLWFHNGSAQCTSVLKMASVNANQDPFLANYEVANKVVYSNPSILNVSLLAIPNAFTSGSTFSGTWTPVKGQPNMSSSVLVNAPGDWLYNTGSGFLWTVAGPSTAYPDSGGRNGSGLGTGSYTSSTTNSHYGMLPTAAYNSSSLWTGINSYAFYIK